MVEDTRQTRRHLLRIAPAVAGMGAIAGCLRLDASDDSSSEDNGGSSTSGSDTSQDQSSNDDTQDDTESEPDGSESSTSFDDGGTEGPEARAETFASDNEANLYEGLLEDMTGQDEVVIETGAGDNGFSFSPSGIVVSTGTNVVWEWTGNGGAHNVVSQDDSDYNLESELTDEAGYTIEGTIEEPGVVLYVCVPHQAQGMYGAVAIVE